MGEGATTKLTLSGKEFHQALLKGIVQDNLAMTFGEGKGMVGFFHLVLPDARLPSHQTLRRDLDMTFEQLGKKVQLCLEVCLNCFHEPM